MTNVPPYEYDGQPLGEYYGMNSGGERRIDPLIELEKEAIGQPREGDVVESTSATGTDPLAAIVDNYGHRIKE